MTHPEILVEVHELGNDGSGENDSAFEPFFPADVARRQDHGPSVDDYEFGVHDAKWQDENRFDLQIQATELVWVRKPELFCPRGAVVDLPGYGLLVEELLE